MVIFHDYFNYQQGTGDIWACHGDDMGGICKQHVSFGCLKMRHFMEFGGF